MSVNDDIQQALNAYEANESILRLACKWGEANEKLLQAAKDFLNDPNGYTGCVFYRARLCHAVSEVEKLAAEDKKDRT